MLSSYVCTLGRGAPRAYPEGGSTSAEALARPRRRAPAVDGARAQASLLGRDAEKGDAARADGAYLWKCVAAIAGVPMLARFVRPNPWLWLAYGHGGSGSADPL